MKTKTLLSTLLASVITAGAIFSSNCFAIQNAEAFVGNNSDETLLYKAISLEEEDAKEGIEVSYGLYDINKDGVKELIYSRHFNRQEILIYRYNEKLMKPALVKTTDGEKSLTGVTSIKKIANKKQIAFSAAGSAFEGNVISWKLTKAGKLKPVTVYYYDFSSNKFTKNDKKITKKAMNKYMKKFGKLKNIDLMTTKKKLSKQADKKLQAYGKELMENDNNSSSGTLIDIDSNGINEFYYIDNVNHSIYFYKYDLGNKIATQIFNYGEPDDLRIDKEGHRVFAHTPAVKDENNNVSEYYSEHSYKDGISYYLRSYSVEKDASGNITSMYIYQNNNYSEVSKEGLEKAKEDLNAFINEMNSYEKIELK
ncbi:MAG: hypothetical protein K6F00_10600 [Lachnospiraceae bacterium]|nr:hypothetical protein [Lachnospiraceae bacterium]